MIEELAALDANSTDWMTKFEALKHDYTHHIDEEEEEMFPAASGELSDEKVAELRAIFDRRKPREVERAKVGADEGDDRD